MAACRGRGCSRCRWLDNDFVGSGVASLGDGDGSPCRGCDGSGRRGVALLLFEGEGDLGTILQQADPVVEFQVFAGNNCGRDEKLVFVRNLQSALF